MNHGSLDLRPCQDLQGPAEVEKNAGGCIECRWSTTDTKTAVAQSSYWQDVSWDEPVAPVCTSCSDQSGLFLSSSISSAFHTTHLSSALLLLSIGPARASIHILARPAASASNLPALRMFISATRTRRKSGFSRGSRCFTISGPETA